MHNVEIGRCLDEVADLLEAQGANHFRVEAYRRAADGVRHLPKPLIEIWREHGEQGLRAVTGVGERLATALKHLVTTGRLPMLDRLRGETDPVALLESVPGIGRALAERFHGELGIDSLEDLEAAAHDGRLSDLAGIGKKKLGGIIDTLATRLGRVRLAERAHEADAPSVAEILDVDREYREKAAAGELHTIAPRRFNPSGESWLPILHTHRGERNYTALFSNTARAHQFGKTRDWVVLYYDAGLDERQATVITAHRGMLAGKRIVRGREPECEQHYAAAPPCAMNPQIENPVVTASRAQAAPGLSVPAPR
jgi:Holliday junction resolvasome RuvABC DNA-binding subunit